MVVSLTQVLVVRRWADSPSSAVRNPSPGGGCHDPAVERRSPMAFEARLPRLMNPTLTTHSHA